MSPVTQRPRELMMSRWMSRNWFEITVMKVGRNVAEGEYPRLVSGRGGRRLNTHRGTNAKTRPEINRRTVLVLRLQAGRRRRVDALCFPGALHHLVSTAEGGLADSTHHCC